MHLRVIAVAVLACSCGTAPSPVSRGDTPPPTPPSGGIELAEAATFAELVDTLAGRAADRSPCYLVPDPQRADVPTVHIGFGSRTIDPAFSCDYDALLPLVEGRAIYLEEILLTERDGGFATAARVLRFGPRGHGYLDRAGAVTGAGGSAWDMLHLGNQPDEVKLMVLYVDPAASAATAGPQALELPEGSGTGLDWDDIGPVVGSAAADVRECFAARGAVPAGAISIDVVVGVAGDVTELGVLSSTVADRDAETCVLDAIRALRFPERERATLMSMPLLLAAPPQSSP